MNTIVLESKIEVALSDKTAELRKTIQAASKDLLALAPQIAAALNDDKTDAEKLSAKLADLRARESIMHARLARRKDELYAEFVNDVKQAVALAEKEMLDARERWRECRDGWSQSIRAERKKLAADRIIQDPSLHPVQVKGSRGEYDACVRDFTEVSKLLRLIDKATAERGAENLAVSMTGEPYIRPVAWYRGNAAKYVPELS